jgi:hypothetical protein
MASIYILERDVMLWDEKGTIIVIYNMVCGVNYFPPKNKAKMSEGE